MINTICPILLDTIVKGMLRQLIFFFYFMFFVYENLVVYFLRRSILCVLISSHWISASSVLPGIVVRLCHVTQHECF